MNGGSNNDSLKVEDFGLRKILAQGTTILRIEISLETTVSGQSYGQKRRNVDNFVLRKIFAQGEGN